MAIPENPPFNLRKGWWQSSVDHRDWGRAWFNPWWGTQHRALDYINEPFNNPQDLQVWRDLGYTQTTFTGDLYDMRYPEPPWIDRFRYFLPLRHFSWSVYRMRPGTTLPEHSDTYARFREIYDISPDVQIRRYVIFLEDWASGHYLEVDGEPLQPWLAGTAVFWHDGLPHLAANVGKTDRYTLQITGVVDPETHLWRTQHGNDSLF
jgi:hypothetical protein